MKQIAEWFYNDASALAVASIPSKGGAYLFAGPKWIGKAHAAEAVAKKVLETEDLSGCPDYMVLSPNSKNMIGIDDLGGLMDYAQTIPVNGDVKVALVDDAETMTEAAQNAVLKLLEESTDYMLFLLVSHGKMIPTVESRCMKIPFSVLSKSDMEDILHDEDEKIDSLALQLAKGRLGFYQFTLDEPKYLESIRTFMKALEVKDMAGMFEAFHLMKEKDKENFFESYSMSQVMAFVTYLQDVFYKVFLYQTISFREDVTDCDIVKVAEHYSVLYVQALTSTLTTAQRSLGAGKFNKNDWFDLIRFIAE